MRAAYPAIKAADPGAQVLIGAMSSRGVDLRARNSTLRPLVFLRALGCVSSRFRKLRSGDVPRLQARSRRRLRLPPARHADLAGQRLPQPRRRQPRARSGDSSRRSTACSAPAACAPSTRRFNLYLDEYGYQTRPPDRTAGVSLANQDRWLQRAAYRAWRDRRVRLLTQYQWYDEPLRRAGSPYRRLAVGPALPEREAEARARALRHADALDAARSRLWGQVRPGGAQTVTVERRLRGCDALRPARARAHRRARLLDAQAAAHPRRALSLPDRGGVSASFRR